MLLSDKRNGTLHMSPAVAFIRQVKWATLIQGLDQNTLFMSVLSYFSPCKQVVFFLSHLTPRDAKGEAEGEPQRRKLCLFTKSAFFTVVRISIRAFIIEKQGTVTLTNNWCPIHRLSYPSWAVWARLHTMRSRSCRSYTLYIRTPTNPVIWPILDQINPLAWPRK